MIDIRGRLYSLLNTLSIECHHTRIDPFKSDKFPALSVQYDRISRKQKGHDNSFQVTASVLIVLAVATIDLDFDDQLDTLVNNVLTKLLTDQSWCVEDIERISDITTKYGYVKGGEVDLSTAVISMDVLYFEQYDPITTDWKTTHIDIDYISPFDPNTGPSGPDGILEGTLDFDNDADIEKPLLEDYDTLPENKR